MPCYICLEEEGKTMKVRGCYCKGGIDIHKACLQQWMNTAVNPFNCSVCKGEYSTSFLKKFLTMEEIMFHPRGTDEEEDLYDNEDLQYNCYNGIEFLSTDDKIIFKKPEHVSIYFEMINKEHCDIKKESRRIQKNSMRFKVKTHRMPKWSKSIPFRK